MRPEFCLFLDENHCNNANLRKVLVDRKVRFEPYSDHFKPGVPDTEWLPFVGAKGWALLTTDKRIRYRALEREAVAFNRVAMYYFSTNKMNGAEMAAAVDRALNAMQSLFERHQPPYFAAVTRAGDVYLR